MNNFYLKYNKWAQAWKFLPNLTGVRGKMLKMRAEADSATERADQLAKELAQTKETLHQTEEERNSLQRWEP